jgi:all-trans-retinol 13,14-reductase
MTDFDTIVIGSGAGGLAAALALARAGQRVLVLEQHYVPGGWCHSFTLKGFHFSPGVHYIGELQPGGRMRQIYEGLGVANDISFFELPPDGFDHVRVGSERFDIPKGKETYAARMADRFPRDARGIKKVLDIFGDISRELDEGLEVLGPADVLALPFRTPSLLRHGLLPLSRVVNSRVEDPLARAILTIQAGDHGLPPEKALTAVHAAVVGHYYGGGWYPKGGAFTIPRAFVRALERHRGEIRLETEVAEIMIEGGRAIGVRLASGEEIRASRVISNADPHVTFGKLVPKEMQSRFLRWRVARAKYSCTSLSLFLAADMDVRAAGLDGGNYWWSRDTNISAGYESRTKEQLMKEEVPGLFLTCTTLKDPTKRRDRLHTMEVFTFVPFESFPEKRGPEYDAMKAQLLERMLDGASRVVPGLRERVVFAELGTPLTNVNYCRATQGNLYGTEKSLFHVGPFGFQPKTGIRDLYLCGASTIGHGVAGATISGLVAAGLILGTTWRELLTDRGQNLECHRSDDPSNWPERMRSRVMEREAARERPHA